MDSISTKSNKSSNSESESKRSMVTLLVQRTSLKIYFSTTIFSLMYLFLSNITNESRVSAEHLKMSSATAVGISGPSTFIKPTATGNGSGSDWDNALGASGFKTAVLAGGDIRVAAGTYMPGSLTKISNDICITGGYPASSTGQDLSLIHI